MTDHAQGAADDRGQGVRAVKLESLCEKSRVDLDARSPVAASGNRLSHQQEGSSRKVTGLVACGIELGDHERNVLPKSEQLFRRENLMVLGRV